MYSWNITEKSVRSVNWSYATDSTLVSDYRPGNQLEAQSGIAAYCDWGHNGMRLGNGFEYIYTQTYNSEQVSR